MADDHKGRYQIQYTPDFPREVDCQKGIVQESDRSEDDHPSAYGIIVFPLLISQPGTNHADTETQEGVEPIGPRKKGKQQKTGGNKPYSGMMPECDKA